MLLTSNEPKIAQAIAGKNCFLSLQNISCLAVKFSLVKFSLKKLIAEKALPNLHFEKLNTFPSEFLFVEICFP